MTTAIGPLPAEEAAWAQADAPPTLTLIDLLNDTPTLTSHLCVQVAAGNWLDAFLLAVGVHQIAEDHWQRGRLGLRRAGGYLTQMDGRAARLAGGVAEGADRLDTWARANMPAVSRRGADLGPLAALIRDLCRSAMQVGGEPDRTALYRRAGAVSHAINTEPRREDDIVRLPSCFRSFDQRLEDVVRLARSFAERWPDRRQPLTVVGVRTSGSYLGPATAVALEGLGYSNITTATVRPGWPTPPVVRAALGDRAAAGSRFLIVDDPPMTGRSLADAVGQVRRAGTVGADRIAVLIALGPSGEADADRDLLGGAPVISLPWDRWAVHDQLTAGHVGQALTGLLPGGSWVRRTDAITSPTRPRRGHVRSVFRVELVDGATGAAVAETVAVEGVGLGYLGRHAVAVARAAPELVPPVFGFADGMLYRHWLPGGRERGDGSATAGTGGTNGSCAHGAGANGSGAGGTGGDNQAWADRARFLGSVAGSIAGSIAMRRHVLAVPVDRSLVLRGRQPAWEVASRLISRSLGPLALPLRLPVVDPLVRRLLQPAEPSIVDGTTGLDRWILQDDGGVRKVDFAEGPFSHEDLATYDAVFDLAGVAVSSKSSTFARSLRTSYLLTGAAVDAERWMLHRLIHVWNETRLGRMTPATADRISAQVVETYFAERYLDDLPVPTDGPFAALDLDGVLETSPLGFPTTTTAGALALRALRAHHFRLVLVTGRSLSEVVERCDTYGATGGVAEYGSVVYDHGRRSVTELVTHDDQRATEGLRTAATTLAEVEVDHDYRHIVRLFRRGPAGRSGLDGDTARALSVTTAAQEHTRPLLPVLGEMQTDFVPADVDKRRGLTVLLDQLGSPVGSSPASPDGNSPGGNSPGTGRPGGRLAHRLALAVGDSTSDAGFLQLADCAVAPANATLQSDGVEFVPGAYQLGLFQAVTRLLGHRPGSCPTCIGPEHSDGARDLLALLSFQENGGRDAARRLASMAARSWSARRRP